MGNLERLLVFAVVQRGVLAIVAGAEAAFVTIEPCEGLTDVLTGCGGTFNSITTSAVLGTIPGPAWTWLAMLNLALAILLPAQVTVAIVKVARGVSD